MGAQQGFVAYAVLLFTFGQPWLLGLQLASGNMNGVSQPGTRFPCPLVALLQLSWAGLQKVTRRAHGLQGQKVSSAALEFPQF